MVCFISSTTLSVLLLWLWMVAGLDMAETIVLLLYW